LARSGSGAVIVTFRDVALAEPVPLAGGSQQPSHRCPNGFRRSPRPPAVAAGRRGSRSTRRRRGRRPVRWPRPRRRRPVREWLKVAGSRAARPTGRPGQTPEGFGEHQHGRPPRPISAVADRAVGVDVRPHLRRGRPPNPSTYQSMARRARPRRNVGVQRRRPGGLALRTWTACRVVCWHGSSWGCEDCLSSRFRKRHAKPRRDRPAVNGSRAATSN